MGEEAERSNVAAKQVCVHCVGQTPRPHRTPNPKHPFYTPFHTDSNERHVINGLKFSTKRPSNLWKRAKTRVRVVADIQNIALCAFCLNYVASTWVVADKTKLVHKPQDY